MRHYAYALALNAACLASLATLKPSHGADPPLPALATTSPGALGALDGKALCQGHDAQLKRMWRAFNRKHKTRLFHGDTFNKTCVPTPTGAWAVIQSDLKYIPPKDPEDPDPYEAELSGRWTLAYLTPDGHQLVAKPGGPWRGELSHGTTEHTTLSLKLLTDYDHDGVTELLVTSAAWGGGLSDDPKSEVVTMKNDAIVAYPKTEGINVVKVQDVDHDGLPDLWTHAPFEEESSDGNGRRFLRGPRLLLHAQADGTFAYDHALGIAALRRGCPTAPRKVLEEDDGEATLLNTACARFYAVPTKQLIVELKRKKTEASDTEGPHWLEISRKWAALDAPIHLSR